MAETERHRVRLAVYLILRRGDKILMLRRAHTGYMDGKLSLPSGHVDGNEPAEMAMVREAKEEVGVTITPQDIRLAHTLHRMAEEGGHEYIDLYFQTGQWGGEPKNMEPHKCSELPWVDMRHLPADVIPAVRSALDEIAHGEPYSSMYF